jgi:hypothetical protein
MPLVRSLVPAKPFHLEELSPGVLLHRLYPGGLAGPNGETGKAIAGGQNWSDVIMLGTATDDFIFAVPDIRMPPNQLWPMHWHDCWTLVVIVEGSCVIGDWFMMPGDVFFAPPSIEYGPLLSGPGGCRLLEIFSDLALAAGGYAPEYHDHPTLQGGTHVFKPRTGINLRNVGNSSLSLEGELAAMKSVLAPGRRWRLGHPDDAEPGAVWDTRLAAGEAIAPCTRGDWYAALVLDGSAELAGRTLVKDDVLIIKPGGRMARLVGGLDGVHLLEHFRTGRALDQRALDENAQDEPELLKEEVAP